MNGKETQTGKLKPARKKCREYWRMQTNNMIKLMERKKKLDKICGSMLGGAIGDALGYPVEFLSMQEIRSRYGERGVSQLRIEEEWDGDFPAFTGKALVSDDTQMTLYTANGLLNAVEHGPRPAYLEEISRAYQDWYLTQTSDMAEGSGCCWINRIKELHNRRAPGNTCLSALRYMMKGMLPVNNSKGCGGVMRIAPIPLYAAVDGRMSAEEAMALAAKASELTHKHPMGFIPSALEAYVIYKLVEDDDVTLELLLTHIEDGFAELEDMFPMHLSEVEQLRFMIGRAVDMAHGCSRPDVADLESIGGGWVADEALAMALYCAVKHFGHFERAVTAAVNHGGDSDSVGAILGNILGAAMGYEALPGLYVDGVEMRDVILHMASDLWRGFVSPDAAGAHLLYRKLQKATEGKGACGVRDIGDGMRAVECMAGQGCRQSFLVDDKAEKAFLFIDGLFRLRTIDRGDIDWRSLQGLTAEAIECAHSLCAVYPTEVQHFVNGVGEVTWQINPDRHYCVDDGGGMTDDTEVTLRGFIDRKGKPLGKFRVVRDMAELAGMRRKAEKRHVE